MDLEGYFAELEGKVEELYRVAKRARARGLDPSTDVEVARGDTLGQRLVALFDRPDLAESVEGYLRQGYGKVETAFKVAGDILETGGADEEELAELAVRVGMAIMTDATVSAPIEGISSVRVKVNPRDGTRYLAVYYNGPIRTAGGTEGALSVVLADFVRQKLGLDRYRPTDEEVERYVEEVELYRRAVHLQYNSTPDEVRYVARHLVVEVTGPPTEDVEVSTNRDLPTVETNRIRGGAALVLNDCLLQKRKKLAKTIPGLREVVDFDTSGWEWVRGSGDVEDAEGEGGSGGGCPYVPPSYKYLRDSVVGRPVLAHPSAVGGFRLRYGHARNTGLASVGVHPATMAILENFLAVGTQVRIERPGKSAVVMPVDSIEGPVVRLRDGSVVRVEDLETAEAVLPDVDRILFLGDVLIGFGEFLENNHVLLPSAWVEEWWYGLLTTEAERRNYRLPDSLREGPFAHVDFDTAVELSLSLGVPLHPRWTYFWHDLTVDRLSELVEALRNSTFDGGTLRIPDTGSVKDSLERLCVPHRVEEGAIVVEGDDAKALQTTLLSKDVDLSPYGPHEVMRAVNDLAPYRVMPKAPHYIGMRLGRPEKAKPRKMKPPVNVLFPIGRQRGMSRSLKKALQSGLAAVEVALRRCPSCGAETVHYTCPSCGVRTEPQLFCPRCGRRLREGQRCPDHPREEPVNYRSTELNVRAITSEAVDRLGGGYPLDGVKCVQGLTSRSKSPEPLEKGILRAHRDLYVFKDGTIRFDVTNASLTHFTPAEVGVSPEKLRELGYEEDIYGRPLVSDDQLLELRIQDVIIPRKAAEYLYQVSKFIDELLTKFYGLDPFYNLRRPEDLVGHVLFTISPHTFVANAVRVVGFTDADVILAHPYLHAAKRRNVDGDEDSLILGLDCLLNFSKSYLPSKPGGREDAPLILVTRIDLEYIDDECYNIEVVWSYPKEFFEATLEYRHPQEVEGSLIQTVGATYASGDSYPSIGFTHPTSHCWRGPLVTAYRTLRSMLEKLERHISLEEKISAVDPEDAITRAMSAHFLRDIAGNLRKYASQKFRCLKCNRKFRRPPLSGRCPYCGGDITLTIHPRSTVKYLEPTKRILEAYNLRGYLLQRVELLEDEANSLFDLASASGQEGGTKARSLTEFSFADAAAGAGASSESETQGDEGTGRTGKGERSADLSAFL